MNREGVTDHPTGKERMLIAMKAVGKNLNLLAVLFAGVLLAVVLFGSYRVYADEVLTPDEYAMDSVYALIDAEEDAWTEETEISERYTLYAPDDTVAGYVYSFETNGKPHGYLMFTLYEGAYLTDYFTFYGTAFSGFFGDAGIDRYRNADRVYYGGGFAFYVKNGNGEYVTCAVEGVADAQTYTQEEVQIRFDQYRQMREEHIASALESRS